MSKDINKATLEKVAKIPPVHQYRDSHLKDVGAKHTETIDGKRYVYLHSKIDGEKDKKVVSTTEKAKLPRGTTLILNNGFKAVHPQAFKNNENLEGFIACETLEDICDTAFAGAVNLEKVLLNYGFKTICGDAFADCYSLGGIWLPETVEAVSETAFVRSGLRVVICGEKQIEMVEKLKSVNISKIFVIDENSLVKEVISKQSIRNDVEDEVALENIRYAIEDLIYINEDNREILQPIIDRFPKFKAGGLRELQTPKLSRREKKNDAITL